MSADAYVRKTDDGWKATHDGSCTGGNHESIIGHCSSAYDLVGVLMSVEQCFGQSLHWVVENLEDGTERLRGWCAR